MKKLLPSPSINEHPRTSKPIRERLYSFRDTAHFTTGTRASRNKTVATGRVRVGLAVATLRCVRRNRAHLCSPNRAAVISCNSVAGQKGNSGRGNRGKPEAPASFLNRARRRIIRVGGKNISPGLVHSAKPDLFTKLTKAACS